MTKDEMWEELLITYPYLKGVVYDAWSFGGTKEESDYLAECVKDNIKTATTSAYQLYAIEHEKIPSVGEISIILDSKGKAICVIETTKVYICQFNEVSKEHAFKEGEGNQSLEYWKTVHKEFFTTELKQYNQVFDENILVVCEEFKLLYM